MKIIFTPPQKKIARLLLCALLFVPILGCENEELDSYLNETREISILEKEIRKADFSKMLPEDFVAAYEKESNIYLEYFEDPLIQIPIEGVFQSSNHLLEFKYYLLAVKKKESFELYVAKLTSQRIDTTRNLSLEQLNGFIGNIAIREVSSGNQIVSSWNEDGYKESKKNKISRKYPVPPYDYEDEPGSGGGGSWIYVRTDHYTDWYQEDENGDLYKTNTQFHGSTYEYIYQYNDSFDYFFGHRNFYSSGGGGGRDSGSRQLGIVDAETRTLKKIRERNGEFEEQIIYSSNLENKYPCQTKLIKQAQNVSSPITNLFKDIFNNNSEPNVIFDTKDFNDIFTAAYTDGRVNHNYKTYFNSERLNTSTDLDIVNTTIHEMVHANLYHFHRGGEFKATNPESYADLVEDFCKHRARFGGDHHEYMASLTKKIAEASYVWASQHGYSENQFSEYKNLGDSTSGLKNYLNILAWNGLTGTEAFAKEFGNKTTIIKQIINYEGLPNDAGSKPKGKKPCK